MEPTSQEKNGRKELYYIKQVGSVTYLTDNSQNIFQKDIDQLCAAYTNSDVDIMNIFVKTILQKIKIINYYPNHKIPIEPHLLNQILSVKIGNYFNILLKHQFSFNSSKFYNQSDVSDWVILHQFCTDQRDSKNHTLGLLPVREEMLCFDALSKQLKSS